MVEEGRDISKNIERSLVQKVTRPFVSALKEFVATPFRVAKLATKEFGSVASPLVTAAYFGLMGVGAVALISGRVSDPLDAGTLAAGLVLAYIGANRLATLELKERSIKNSPTPAV